MTLRPSRTGTSSAARCFEALAALADEARAPQRRDERARAGLGAPSSADERRSSRPAASVAPRRGARRAVDRVVTGGPGAAGCALRVISYVGHGFSRAPRHRPSRASGRPELRRRALKRCPTHGGSVVDTFLQDLRHSLRTAWNSPAFTFAAVAALALASARTRRSSRSSTPSCCGRCPTRIRTAWCSSQHVAAGIGTRGVANEVQQLAAADRRVPGRVGVSVQRRQPDRRRPGTGRDGPRQRRLLPAVRRAGDGRPDLCRRLRICRTAAASSC